MSFKGWLAESQSGYFASCFRIMPILVSTRSQGFFFILEYFRWSRWNRGQWDEGTSAQEGSQLMVPKFVKAWAGGSLEGDVWQKRQCGKSVRALDVRGKSRLVGRITWRD